MTILRETLADLRSAGELEGRTVRAVHPTPYFAVVELEDGGVGAGMSYYRCNTEQAILFREQIQAFVKSDPLLLGWLFEEPQPWARVGREGEDGQRLILALQTALLSALSARCLRTGGDDFRALSSPPDSVFAGATRALVIGFGGYMTHFASREPFRQVHVCDLYYHHKTGMMEQFADRYREKRPELQLTLSDGHDTESRMREADIVTITGSTLCNGTLEQLLEMARGGPRVVVQGESAGILPGALFRRGVSMSATTIKPLELARLAGLDPSGDRLKPLLEGGLDWTYFLPRSARGDGID